MKINSPVYTFQQLQFQLNPLSQPMNQTFNTDSTLPSSKVMRSEPLTMEQILAVNQRVTSLKTDCSKIVRHKFV